MRVQECTDARRGALHHVTPAMQEREERGQKWEEMAKVVRPSLCYSYNKHTKARSLLIKFNDDDDDDDLGFETAYQMRNVEGQAGTFIIQ